MTVFRIALVVFLVLATAFWALKQRLPGPEDIRPEVAYAPVQRPTGAEPFRIARGGVDYTVTPLYTYDLRGVVVSVHDTSSWLAIAHERWGDYLNIKDLCVVWGRNVQSGLYRDFNYRSGEFTCFYSSSESSTWHAFEHDALSNNHLLAGDKEVARAIMDADIGDQIRFTGYLASYQHNKGFYRGSSTTRTDTGNGACETVYVTSFETLRATNAPWRMAFAGSKYAALACLLGVLAQFFVGAFSSATAYDHHARAAELAARGRSGAAMRALNKALKMDPAMHEAYRDRAILHEMRGDYDQAARDQAAADRFDTRPPHMRQAANKGDAFD